MIGGFKVRTGVHNDGDAEGQGASFSSTLTVAKRERLMLDDPFGRTRPKLRRCTHTLIQAVRACLNWGAHTPEIRRCGRA